MAEEFSRILDGAPVMATFVAPDTSGVDYQLDQAPIVMGESQDQTVTKRRQFITELTAEHW